MAKWSRDRVDSESLNNGNEFTIDSQVALEELNAIINAGLYSQDFVENLAEGVDISDANNQGIPIVSFVDYIKNGKTFKKFKFSNIKGEPGQQGEAGVSISDVKLELYGTNDLANIYTVVVTLSDGRLINGGRIVCERGAKGDTGEQGVSITSVTSGTASTLGNITTTPLTITFSNGTSTIVNVSAQKGDKGDPGDSGSFDTALSETSENAVQNKVITSEINKKADANNSSQNIVANSIDLRGSFTALRDIGGGFSISDTTNVGVEIGRTDGTAGTPYIDFHTDGQSSTDYNSRLIATGNQLNVNASNGFYVNNNRIDTKCNVDLIFNTRTSAKQNHSLISGYKFSDYAMLDFIFYSTSDNKYRTLTITPQAFSTYVNYSFSDATPNTSRWRDFSYVNDTTFNLGNGGYVDMQAIYGIRK